MLNILPLLPPQSTTFHCSAYASIAMTEHWHGPLVRNPVTREYRVMELVPEVLNPNVFGSFEDALEAARTITRIYTGNL